MKKHIIIGPAILGIILLILALLGVTLAHIAGFFIAYGIVYFAAVTVKKKGAPKFLENLSLGNKLFLFLIIGLVGIAAVLVIFAYVTGTPLFVGGDTITEAPQITAQAITDAGVGGLI